MQLILTDIVLQMVVQAKPLQTLIRLRVIGQDKQGIVQMLSFGVFTKGGDLHNPFKHEGPPFPGGTPVPRQFALGEVISSF